MRTNSAGNLVSTGRNCRWPSNLSHRNMFQGSGAYFIKAAIGKTFPVTERVKLNFRGEFYNLLNHSNYYVQGWKHKRRRELYEHQRWGGEPGAVPGYWKALREPGIGCSERAALHSVRSEGAVLDTVSVRFNHWGTASAVPLSF